MSKILFYSDFVALFCGAKIIQRPQTIKNKIAWFVKNE